MTFDAVSLDKEVLNKLALIKSAGVNSGRTYTDQQAYNIYLRSEELKAECEQDERNDYYDKGREMNEDWKVRGSSKKSRN